MDDLDAAKRTVRAQVRARLPPAGTGAHASLSATAQARLAASAVLAAARRVALYRALPSEVATDALAGALVLAGKSLCFPAVNLDALEFREASGAFVRGALGVEEPRGPVVPLADIDLLVVPAVAVDASGHRLGRGKGYYDRALAGFRGVTVALVFESQLVPSVPVGEHDRRVEWICTDARLVRAA